MNREQVLEAAVKAVSHAKQFTDYVEFSAEDASRSDPEFLIQIFREVIRAGAKVINVPDTTGYAIPSEFGALIANLIERTAGGDRVIWSAHCHNDLGPGGGQFARRRAQRRAPDRVHDQRHRRARRQYFIGRSRDGAAHAQKLSRSRHEHYQRAALSDFAFGVPGHGHPDSDQQAGRRRQRLCPRGGHPSGRRAQAQTDLRNHDAGIDRHSRQSVGHGQALRPPRFR